MIIQVNQEIWNSLTNTEKNIIQFINSQSQRLAGMSIVDIAEETFSSTATVSRAIRKCKIGGFNELRYLISNKRLQKDNITSFNDIFNKSLVEVSKTLELLSIKDLVHTTRLLRAAAKIIVIARGPSAPVAQEFAEKLQLMGYFCVYTNDPNIMVNLSRSLKQEQMVVAFSLNGKTPEIVESCQNAIAFGNQVVSCCCDSNSILAELSSVFLCGYKHDHDSIANYEVASRLPLHVISRVILDYMAYVEKNNITV